MCLQETNNFDSIELLQHGNHINGNKMFPNNNYYGTITRGLSNTPTY